VVVARRLRSTALVVGVSLALGMSTVPAVSAGASSPGSSTVYVTHGLPLDSLDAKVDVFAGPRGTPARAGLLLDDFVFGTTAGPLRLPAADYTVEPAAPSAGDNGALDAGGTIYRWDLPVPAGSNLSAVASFTAPGAPNIAVFVNDVRPTTSVDGRVSIRHAAAAPAVRVDVGVRPSARIFPRVVRSLGPLENGRQADTRLLHARYDVTVNVAGSGATVAGVERFPVKAGTQTNVYAVGVPGSSFTSVVHEIRL
jgi:hypothetical protein